VKTATELCRDNLYKRLGVEQTPRQRKDPQLLAAEIKAMTKKLEEMVELARPRLIMGGIRYGSAWKHEALMDYVESKLRDYRKTGNAELLVDVFNLVTVEAQLKTHPNFHYKPIDRRD